MNFEHECECDGDYGFGGMAAGDEERCANCPLRGHVHIQPRDFRREREQEYFRRKKDADARVSRDFNLHMIDLFNQARRKS